MIPPTTDTAPAAIHSQAPDAEAHKPYPMENGIPLGDFETPADIARVLLALTQIGQVEVGLTLVPPANAKRQMMVFIDGTLRRVDPAQFPTMPPYKVLSAAGSIYFEPGCVSRIDIRLHSLVCIELKP